MYSMKILSERIKGLRKEMGMTQKQFADECGLSKELIYQLENEKKSGVDIDTIDKISEACQVSFHYLLGISNYRSAELEDMGIRTGLPEKLLKDLISIVEGFNAFRKRFRI